MCVKPHSARGMQSCSTQYGSRHLYSAYSGIDGPAYPGNLNDMHHKPHSGSEILAHPNFIAPMMLAKFRPHWDALHYALTHASRP